MLESARQSLQRVGQDLLNGIYDFGVFNGNVIVYLGDAGKPFFDFDGYEYTLDFVVP